MWIYITQQKNKMKTYERNWKYFDSPKYTKKIALKIAMTEYETRDYQKY